MVTNCPKCGYQWNKVDTSRPRSTGPHSQSAHLHGHLQTLAQFCGYSLGEMKDVMKADNAFWPHHEVKVGSVVRVVPISEADMNSVDESLAIEWCHMRAAEVGCVLQEGSDAGV